MHQRQAEVIDDFLLGQRHLKSLAVCQTGLEQSAVQIQQQGGDPLLGVALAKSRYPVVQPPLVFGELKHDPHACGMVPRHKFQQTFVIDRAHIGLRQAFDRVRLALKQHTLDAHKIAGQENHDHLPPAIFDLASPGDRKSTRLNSSHVEISYAVFCLKKKKKKNKYQRNCKKE